MYNEKIEQALQALDGWANTNCKYILKSFYFDKVPLKQLAQELGYTENYIKKRKKQCLDALRAELDKWI